MNLKIVDINIVAKELGLFEKNENTNDVDTRKTQRNTWREKTLMKRWLWVI